MTEETGDRENLETFQDEDQVPETFSFSLDDDPTALLEISLDFPYSSREWDAIFEVLLNLLTRLDLFDQVINQFIQALEMEASLVSDHEDYQPKPVHERLYRIFQAIAAQTLLTPEIFERFCSRFQFITKNQPYRRLTLEWLEQLAAENPEFPTQNLILAARIFLGAYDSTWQEVGSWLVTLLDHADLNIRACAADQIGKFCHRASVDQAEMMQLIRSKEIERPGVAGAFWDEIPKTGFDAKEWLLDILENSPEPEPYIPYFPCNLAFDAHERFSRDADAIRRLIDMNQVSIALAAATDETERIDAIAPLLIELGNYDAPEMTRLASWHLAYYYHHLHPRGAELGFVELLSDLPEIDLFLLFNSKQVSQSPYAAVIYAKGTGQKLERAIAQKWVNQIFPKSVRGEIRQDLPTSSSHWCERGYVEYCNTDADSDALENVIIGYRSSVLWNPKQFL
jgi:hypothetical protein